MVSVSGYLIGNQEAGRTPLPARRRAFLVAHHRQRAKLF
jgi:hypothetical protein